MAEPNAASETRILTLRRRWEADRTSSAFLPLAEEFRRLGRFGEAIEALETGLRLQPTYLSAQVALGRCRLESGDAVGAAAVLEKVLTTDPTQLVANKLLIEAYLQSGDPRRARERLNAYSALNERDADLPSLRQRILIRLAGAAPIPEMAAPSESEPAGHLADAESGADDDLFALPPVAASSDLSALWPAAFPVVPERGSDDRPGLGAVDRGPRAVNGAAGDGDLFPGLRGPAVTERYLSSLFGEGLFQGAVPAATGSSAGSTSGTTSEDAAAQPSPVPDSAAQAAQAAAPEAARAAEPEAASDATAELEYPEPEFTVSPVAAASPASPVSSADVPAVPADSIPADSLDALGDGWSEGVAWTEAGAELDAEPGESAAPPADATVTLGTLYLGQGHRTEAAEIFNAVLDREPENVAARQGLELVGLADESHLEAMAPPEGVTARKVRVLRGYLGSLRQGAPGDVS